jgi:hypothetical protein
MYKLSIITIHKNAIKNNQNMFITSRNYHEYTNNLKNEYG